MIRYAPRIEFEESILESAKKIDVPKNFNDFYDYQIRQDFSYQECFTIDDETTKDMDDALYLETTDNGYIFYVHISDVAYLIGKDTLLDIEARKRVSSIYCPEIEIPMFPWEISHDKASLVQGQMRPAISTIFHVNSDFEITSADIQPSVIKVAKRYSYHQVDQYLKDLQEPFITIQSITALHEQLRLDQGALPVVKRDAQPTVLENNEIIVTEVDEQSPARAMIGEAMVLTNIVSANFFRANKIPALYRAQDKPEEDDKILDIPQGSARDYAQRGKLKRSTLSTVPKYHATLGTSAYVQISSPIRRYLDLVLQRQMLYFFKDEIIFYSEKDLLDLYNKIEEGLQIAQNVSKESKRFWILRYLEKYYFDGRSLFGTVIRTDTKYPIVELDEIFINVPAKIARPQLGQKYELKIERIDPRFDFIRLEPQKKSIKANN